MIRSNAVGKIFISGLKIERTDQSEKKNDATEVGRDSSFTENGITTTNRDAAAIRTVAVIRTKGFLRISNLTRSFPSPSRFTEAVSHGM
jgi:hypothetical protein